MAIQSKVIGFLTKEATKAGKSVANLVKKAATPPKAPASRFTQAAVPRTRKTTVISSPRASSSTPVSPTFRNTSPTRTVSPSAPQTIAPSSRPFSPVPESILKATNSSEARAAYLRELAQRQAADNAARSAREASDRAAREAANRASDSSPSKFLTDAESRELGLNQSVSNADSLLRDGIVSRADELIPPASIAPATAVIGDAAEAAVDAVAPAARRKIFNAANAGLAAPFVPAAAVQIAESSGLDVPGPLKGAANLALILGGGRLGFRSAKPLASPTVRESIKNLPGNKVTKPLRQIKAFTKPVVGTTLGGVTGIAGALGLTTPPSTQAEASPGAPAVVPELESVLPQLGGAELIPGQAPGLSPEDEIKTIIDQALGNIESGAGTIDDANTVANGEKSILDSSVADAMAELEAAYGGPEQVTTAVTAGDPILLQQLAAIDADYQAGLLQIQANYAGALGQVAGYQAQADALLKDVAAQQMAGFAAAAGGLEAMSPGVGLTGSQAAAAGVSDTALGGAGITGAALARGLAGASSAQAAADRLRLGTDLSGQLATGRLTQADIEAALSRAAAGEKAVARTESAQREADARALAKQQKREDAIRIAELKYQAALDKQAEAVRKEENEAARKQRVAELKFNAELDLAKQIAAMTPAERAAYQGSTAGKANFKTPSWYGKLDSRDPNLKIDVKGAKLEGSITVGMKQRFNDLMDAQLAKPESTNPATARDTWAVFFNDIGANPDVLAIYQSSGRPTSATAMYKELFGSTPKK